MSTVCLLMRGNCQRLICIKDRWETGTSYNFIHIWVPPLISPLLLTRGQMRTNKAHSRLEKGHTNGNWSLLEQPWITKMVNSIKARTFNNWSAHYNMLSPLQLMQSPACSWSHFNASVCWGTLFLFHLKIKTSELIEHGSLSSWNKHSTLH